MKTTITLKFIVSTIVVASLTVGCGPGFEDDTQSILKKAEILSIILDPPEASPGDTVKISFLAADEKGALSNNFNLWLPMDAANSDDSDDSTASDLESLAAMSAESGLTFEDLLSPIIEYTVPSKEGYAYNEDGFAAQMLSLFIEVKSIEVDENDQAALFSKIQGYVETGEIKTGIRTLLVSERNEKNRNPEIVNIGARLEDENSVTSLSLVRHDDEDIPSLRRAIATEPFVANGGAELEFVSEVEDDGDLENELRFQWISTGGDFQGRRLQTQPWQAPEYVKPNPDEDEEDLTGKEEVDPRQDPNLHPVWLIVRDIGADNQSGQAWAEFYVRVVEANGNTE